MKKSLMVLTIALVAIFSYAFTTIRPASNKAEGKAYAVTWQNKAGFWFAVGPLQSLQIGEKEEEKALDLVKGYKAQKGGNVKFIGKCGKFKVYELGVDYDSYDIDAIKWVKKYGYDCNWP